MAKSSQPATIADEIELALCKTSHLLGMIQDDAASTFGFAARNPNGPADHVLGRQQATAARRLALSVQIESHLGTAISLLDTAANGGVISPERAADEQDRLTQARYFAHEVGNASVNCAAGLVNWPQQWASMHSELAASMRKLRRGYQPDSGQKNGHRPETQSEAGDDGQSLARMLHVLEGDQAKIIAIMDGDLSTDQKMREICNLDSRYYAKDSAEWGLMLGVKSSAIRQTAFWKVDRKRFLTESEELRKELAMDDQPADKSKSRR